MSADAGWKEVTRVQNKVPWGSDFSGCSRRYGKFLLLFNYERLHIKKLCQMRIMEAAFAKLSCENSSSLAGMLSWVLMLTWNKHNTFWHFSDTFLKHAYCESGFSLAANNGSLHAFLKTKLLLWSIFWISSWFSLQGKWQTRSLLRASLSLVVAEQYLEKAVLLFTYWETPSARETL